MRLVKERIEFVGIIISEYIFRKTYFLANEDTVAVLFSLVEEKRTIYKSNSSENRLTAETLKTSLIEISKENFKSKFIERLMSEDIVEKYIISKEKKDKLLQYSSLDEARPEDYKEIN